MKREQLPPPQELRDLAARSTCPAATSVPYGQQGAECVFDSTGLWGATLSALSSHTLRTWEGSGVLRDVYVGELGVPECHAGVAKSATHPCVFSLSVCAAAGPATTSLRVRKVSEFRLSPAAGAGGQRGLRIVTACAQASVLAEIRASAHRLAGLATIMPPGPHAGGVWRVVGRGVDTVWGLRAALLRCCADAACGRGLDGLSIRCNASTGPDFAILSLWEHGKAGSAEAWASLAASAGVRVVAPPGVHGHTAVEVAGRVTAVGYVAVLALPAHILNVVAQSELFGRKRERRWCPEVVAAMRRELVVPHHQPHTGDPTVIVFYASSGGLAAGALPLDLKAFAARVARCGWRFGGAAAADALAPSEVARLAADSAAVVVPAAAAFAMAAALLPRGGLVVEVVAPPAAAACAARDVARGEGLGYAAVAPHAVCSNGTAWHGGCVGRSVAARVCELRKLVGVGAAADEARNVCGAFESQLCH